MLSDEHPGHRFVFFRCWPVSVFQHLECNHVDNFDAHLLCNAPFSRASVVACENLSGSLKVCTQVKDVLVIALMALLLGDYVKKYRTNVNYYSKK